MAFTVSSRDVSSFQEHSSGLVSPEKAQGLLHVMAEIEAEFHTLRQMHATRPSAKLCLGHSGHSEEQGREQGIAEESLLN